MQRGLSLLAANTPASLAEAVVCFERAIALRRTLPLAETPRHSYGLAASWMNRGDALTRLSSAEQLAEAVHCYDEALALVRDLPLGDDPLYPRRLAIAWINRGITRQKQGATAVDDFRNALAVLDDSRAAAITDLVLLHAGALTNLAGALVDDVDELFEQARSYAQQAIALIKDAERQEIPAGEVGFKARHALCRAIAAESRDGLSLPPELVATATAAVDGGLELARHWEQRGESRFRALAEDLFRFGCRIYEAGPPQELAKFILESLDPAKADGVAPLNRVSHEAAVVALWNALKEIQRDGFTALSTPRFEQVFGSLRELRVTEERLQELRFKR